MGWASAAVERLQRGETVMVRPRGHSMTGKVDDRDLVTVERLDERAGVEVRWTLEGTAAGATRIWVEADLAAVSFFPPSAPQLADLATRQVQTDLDHLRHHLEAGTGGRRC